MIHAVRGKQAINVHVESTCSKVLRALPIFRRPAIASPAAKKAAILESNWTVGLGGFKESLVVCLATMKPPQYKRHSVSALRTRELTLRGDGSLHAPDSKKQDIT
jgi:hypothetical protein